MEIPFPLNALHPFTAVDIELMAEWAEWRKYRDPDFPLIACGGIQRDIATGESPQTPEKVGMWVRPPELPNRRLATILGGTAPIIQSKAGTSP
ncbi:hypothetical protein [Variovorax sp. PAMC 28711]|uniref:hypothetical protein n=1 Tax=Variovorax sp. PAMC 28711 TaxID=1795631 RepID=UPI0012E7003F|nr:hypothetical protein [Variovorax sp. PAMC 28711]